MRDGPSELLKRPLLCQILTPFLSSWRLGSSAAAAATYLLRTDFSQATSQPQSLSDAQVLDTTEEGIVDGSLTVVDTTGTGTCQINNDSYRSETSAASQWGEKGGYSTDTITLDDGLIIYCKAGQETAYGQLRFGIIGATDTAVADANFDVAIATASNLLNPILYQIGSAVGAVQLTSSGDMVDEEREYAIVFDKTNNLSFLYIKSATDYPTWTLIKIASGTLPATARLGLSASWVVTAAYVDFLQITTPETLQPSLVTPTMKDTFTGTGALDGTSPDTEDNGNNWVAVTSAPTRYSGEVRASVATQTEATLELTEESYVRGVANLLNASVSGNISVVFGLFKTSGGLSDANSIGYGYFQGNSGANDVVYGRINGVWVINANPSSDFGADQKGIIQVDADDTNVNIKIETGGESWAANGAHGQTVTTQYMFFRLHPAAGGLGALALEEAEAHPRTRTITV